MLIRLASRALIRCAGPEATAFLQGIITNDIRLLAQQNLLYAFVLGSRGRIVTDLFVYRPNPDEYLLEVDAGSRDNLLRILRLYRMRRKAELEPDETPVNFSADAVEGGLADTRVPGLGYRLLGERDGAARELDYLTRRLEAGVAEGELETKDQIPLNLNGDIMNGISFDKGCYVGQELIARTHHTGVVRRRLMPFASEDLNTDGFIRAEDGTRHGKVIRSEGNRGIGVVALDKVGREALFVKKRRIHPRIPDWWPDHVKPSK